MTLILPGVEIKVVKEIVVGQLNPAGVLGLVALMWFMFAVMRLGFRLFRQDTRHWTGLMSLGVTCGMVAFMAAEMFDNSLRIGASLLYIICTLAALLVTVEKLRERQGAQAQAVPVPSQTLGSDRAPGPQREPLGQVGPDEPQEQLPPKADQNR